MKSRVLVFFAVLTLASCATTYQPQGLMGGYSDTQLDTDLYQVIFHGNGYTSSERASDLALLRCAEIAIRDGFDYFLIVDSQSNIKTTYQVSTDTTYNASAYSSTISGTSTSRSTVTSVNKPSITVTIKLSKEKVGVAYNARIVMNSMRAKYKLS